MIPTTLRFLTLTAPLLCLLLHACDDDDPVKPPPAVVDTTSHNFVWHTDTLGEWLSQVNDVYCLSESNAWAVGWFYVRDSLGQFPDSLAANVAHWDGVKWTLMRVDPKYNGSSTFAELFAVFAFASDDVWVNGRHWNGNTWTPHNVTGISTGKTRKIWGAMSNDVWFTGENGSLMRWDGIRFYQMGFVTTAANLDVWGWNDTMFVAATDYDRESGAPGYVIKLVNGQVKGRETLMGEQIAVWGLDGVWYSGGCSPLYRKAGEQWKIVQQGTRCIKGIRGTALNNVFVVIQRGSVLHYNGKSWKEIRKEDDTGILFPDGMSAVGKTVFIAANINNRSVILRGYRVD